MQHQMLHTSPHIRIEKELVKNIADTISEEIATKMYHKLLLLKFLPEIKAIESGKIKALRGEEAERFLSEISNSK